MPDGPPDELEQDAWVAAFVAATKGDPTDGLQWERATRAALKVVLDRWNEVESSADSPINTKEQNIAFRKAWDERVEAGEARAQGKEMA